mmetsp:Transcript_80694/g.260788  ORF Transcript_80694/g.260788 Transcript_80694/m.260788 type:complete len:234 (+) Transcript_80694:640-1341(+)
MSIRAMHTAEQSSGQAPPRSTSISSACLWRPPLQKRSDLRKNTDRMRRHQRALQVLQQHVRFLMTVSETKQPQPMLESRTMPWRTIRLRGAVCAMLKWPNVVLALRPMLPLRATLSRNMRPGMRQVIAYRPQRLIQHLKAALRSFGRVRTSMVFRLILQLRANLVSEMINSFIVRHPLSSLDSVIAFCRADESRRAVREAWTSSSMAIAMTVCMVRPFHRHTQNQRGAQRSLE